jgi:hypothetical protein
MTPNSFQFHLDKMVGGKKVKSGAPASISGPVGGSLIRPTSVGDFNEVDEDSFHISQMPDNMVIEEFERMLENMNLTQVAFIENYMLYYAYMLLF